MKKIIIAAGMLVFGLTASANIGEEEQTLRYQENKGQVIDTDGNLRDDILFTAESGGVKAYLRETGISYVFENIVGDDLPDRGDFEATTAYFKSLEDGSRTGTVQYHRVDIDFVGANANAQVQANHPYSDYANYYLGHCPQGVLDVQTFEDVTYKEIYPNIDLKFYTHEGHMKYDFIVHPGGNPADIKLNIEGADDASLGIEGELKLKTSLGEITENAPYSYQNGAEVNSSFILSNDLIKFQVGNYDKDRDLIIDPVLLWATYYGGSGADHYTKELDTDPSTGTIYMCAYTNSSNFPTTVGAYDETWNGSEDGSLVAFDSDGSLLWSTYIGGSSNEQTWGLSVDPSGDIFTSIMTFSNNFPTTAGCYDPTYNGSWDYTVSKFDNTGAMLWSTYLGGSGDDLYQTCESDSNGDVIVSGQTNNATFPTTAGAYDVTHNGSYDITVSKLSADGTTLIWSTFLGGTSNEDCRAKVVINSIDEIYIAGQTSGTFPTTAGAFDETYNGGWDVTLSKFSADGSTLLWSTVVGTTGDERYNANPGLCIDGSDNVYLSGPTNSAAFPTTVGAFDETYNGSWDSWIMKFDDTGAQQWSTYVGGTGNEMNSALDHGNGSIYMVSTSSSGGIPVTADAEQLTLAGGYDNVLYEWDSDGNITYCTYYGGASSDIEYYHGITYGTGQLTFSGAYNTTGYPTTSGAYDETHNGSWDYTIQSFRFCDIQLTVDGVTDVLCNGEATGSIDITTTTGTESPVSYAWTGGSTSEDLTGASAGDYTMTATGGATGCTVDLTTITIGEPDTMTASLIGVDPLCFGLSTGSIDLTAGGGVPGYTYSWSGGETTEDISSAAAGMNVVTITDDNGCVFEDSLMINEPTDIDATFIVTDVLCNGDSDGDIDMTTSGGTPGYIFEWSTAETTEDITGLAAGSYTVLITDANGCVALKAATVNEPDELQLDLHVIDVLCYSDSTGSIDLTVIGGTSTFTYAWDNGETTEDITDLPADWYVVDVTDANGCSVTDSAEVTQPDSLELSGTATMETFSGDGSIITSVTGGTAPYTYDWDNGETTPDIYSLAAGDYTLTVTDANGCVVVMTFTVDSQVGIGTSSISGMDVYPNPFKETFNLNFDGQYDYSVFDAAGKLIQTGTGNGQTTIDMTEVESGMYILQLTTSTGMDNIQLIKQ